MSGLSDLANGISGKGFKNPMEMLAENNTHITVSYDSHSNISYTVIGYDPANGFLIGERSNGIVEMINLRQVKTIIPEEKSRAMFR